MRTINILTTATALLLSTGLYSQSEALRLDSTELVVSESTQSRIDSLPTQIGDENMTEGVIILKICVNQDGDVIESNYSPRGSTIDDDELIQVAINNSYKWKFAPASIERQCGVITYRFGAQNDRSKNE